MDDFLTDTKSKLCKMVASFNDIESERRLQLGPLIPEGDTTMDRFANITDTFVGQCMALLNDIWRGWEVKGTQKVEELSKELTMFLK